MEFLVWGGIALVVIWIVGTISAIHRIRETAAESQRILLNIDLNLARAVELLQDRR